ncbi:hypothetical protein GUJ93_ZPchr0010g10239 [Zizania palustris]|uniref:Uncharacterized protein n=1 Tax=Zizania palustris TaxID=103762 RepID=A0A8J6BIG5_ZIZPA|nr:hypothetical protein GUJ93_ZPchr0010g10239 [Zizania palustris]
MSSPPQPLVVHAKASTSNANVSSSLLETRTGHPVRSGSSTRPNATTNQTSASRALRHNHGLHVDSSYLPPLPCDAGSVGSVDPADPAGGDGSYEFVMLTSANGGRGADGTMTESSIEEQGLPSAA